MLDWANLQKIQKELDQFIEKKVHLSPVKLYSYRLLALIVELSELSNFTKVFKFWSNKEKGSFKENPALREELVMEYVDVLHFALSLANYHGLELKESYPIPVPTSPWELSLLFIKLNLDNSKLQYPFSFLEWFRDFLFLGSSLEISKEELLLHYRKKVQINYARQCSGY